MHSGVRALEWDPDDIASVTAVLDAIDDLLEDALYEDPTRYVTLGEALIDELDAHGTEPHPAFDLMRLRIAVPQVESACAQHQLDRAWHWAIAPCAPAPFAPLSVSLDLERPFTAVARFPDVGLADLVRWVGSVCYLGWSAGYLQEEAQHIARRLGVDVLRASARQVELVASVVQVATYLDRWDEPIAELLIRDLEPMVDDTAVPGSTRALLACFLSSRPGLRTRVPLDERASRALVNLADYLDAGQRLQLLVTACATAASEVQHHIQALEGAVDLLNSELEKAYDEDAVACQTARSRRFDSFAPVIRVLLENGDAATAFGLLRRWHGVVEEVEATDIPLFCARIEEAFLWVSSSRVVRTEPHNGALIDLLNETLGLTLVDSSRPTTPELPDRPGVPQYDRGDALEATAIAALQPRQAVEGLGIDGAAISGIVNLAFERLPLAHLLHSVGAPLLPLVASYERPEADRPIHKAQVWVGELLMTTYESEIVPDVLQSGGASVEVINIADASAEAFKEAYVDPDVDLVWVISHAEHGHWRPDSTELILSEDERVTVGELAGLEPSGDGRRLLVLNTCEGAAAAALGGPSQVGLAGVAAGRGQAVISHLWPILPVPAAVFGALLAVGLSRGNDFLEAYRFACASRAEDELRSLLEQNGGARLAEKVVSESLKPFLVRASPVLVV